MEDVTFEEDIPVACVKAASFPEGITEAHGKLLTFFKAGKRRIFGLSRPEKGAIVYFAAAEANRSEAAEYKLTPRTIRKGRYASAIIMDYRKHPQSISDCFESLLRHPGLDQTGYCVEWYFNKKDVRCMVRLE